MDMLKIEWFTLSVYVVNGLWNIVVENGTIKNNSLGRYGKVMNNKCYPNYVSLEFFQHKSEP